MRCKHLWHVLGGDRQDIQASPDGLFLPNTLRNKKWPVGFEMCFSLSTLRLWWQQTIRPDTHFWPSSVSQPSLQVTTRLCPPPTIDSYRAASMITDHWLSHVEALLIASDLLICGELMPCQAFSRWWPAALLVCIIHHQLKVNTKLSAVNSSVGSSCRAKAESGVHCAEHSMRLCSQTYKTLSIIY